MSKFLKSLDYLFLTRPILFFPGWATLLAGYATVGRRHQLVDRLSEGSPAVVGGNGQVVIAVISFAAAMGGCFILNQLQDVETDRQNHKLFLIGDGHVSRRAAWTEAALLILLSLVAASAINHQFAAAMITFVIITGVFYNYRPLRLKDRPLGGLAANMAMGWLAFALGRLTVESLTPTLLKLSLPYLLFNTSLYFLTTLPDYEGDRTGGKITFPVKFGFSATIVCCLLFFLAAVVSAAVQGNQFMLIVGAAAAPFMTFLAIRRSTAAAVVAVKSGIAAFALLTCLLFPVFFLLLAALFFFTRFYYRRRFAFDYPNFRGR